MTFAIYLRDLNVRPHKFLIDVVRERDWESIEDVSEADSEAGALKEFVDKVQGLESIPDNADVFISWFLDQGDVVFSSEFLRFVSEQGWKVTLCVNS